MIAAVLPRRLVPIHAILLTSALLIASPLPSANGQEAVSEKADFFKVHFAKNTRNVDALATEVQTEPQPKRSLDECIAMGLTSQPTIIAANASLAAAQSGARGVDRLILAQLFTPDLPVRKQQACLGIRIAEGAVIQAEWETRYAITRNYYSVIYARMQSAVVKEAVDKLDSAIEKAEIIINSGDVTKVTVIDRDTLAINRALVRARGQEAVVGVDKALAALREAIGVPCDQPFDVVDVPLPKLVTNLDKEGLIALALATRGEMIQATNADQVVGLEIVAQQKVFGPQAKTFAYGGDIHSKPIPQGTSNGNYVPPAIGLEMPPSLAGHKSDRVNRAHAFKERAEAVVVKTENLIRLEVEAMYLKWQEAANKVVILTQSPSKDKKTLLDVARSVAKNSRDRFNDMGKISGEELIRAQTLEDTTLAALNEALYNHALGLAGLERATAGGYRLTVSSQP